MCFSSSDTGQLGEEAERPPERPVAHLVDRVVPEPDGGGVVAKPRPHARPAGDLIDHPGEPLPVQGRLARRLLDRRKQPLELEGEARLSLGGGDRDPGFPRPLQDQPPEPPLDVVERNIQADPERLPQGRDHPGEGGGGGEAGPGDDRAGAKGLRPVGDQERGVGAGLRAQPLADGAPAERGVEREVVGRKLLEAPPATVARPVLAVPVDRPVRLVSLNADAGDQDDPASQVERGFPPSRPGGSASCGGSPRGRSPPRPGAFACG